MIWPLLGDTRTAALADGQGRIVWLCLPHFDGEPVFGALIAGPGGGQFRLGPIDQAEVIDRRYRPGSTVLETTWRVGSAEMLLTEGMISDVTASLLPTFCLVRRLEVRGDTTSCALCFDPRFGIERRGPHVRATRTALVCEDQGTALSHTVDRDVALRPGRME